MLPENCEVVGVVVRYVFLGLTPPPCFIKVKVMSGCNERPEKCCFAYLYWLLLVVEHHLGPVAILSNMKICKE